MKESFQKKIIKSLHDGYTEKRKKPRKQSEALINRSVKSWNQKVINIIGWIILAEHQNIQELTRTVAVELIDQILVYDKKHIEVRFNFDDCYQSLLRQIQSVGCDVNTGMDGRIEIQKREVV